LPVRRTSKRHGISTDSSFHFERGVDPNMIIFALKRAALLMKELAGGIISSEIVDIYPKTIKPIEVTVTYRNIDRLAGKKIHENEVKKILESLEIDILKESKDKLVVKIPPYRVDVTREADVIEEILRIYGYNNIEFSVNLNSNIAYVKKPDRERLVNIVSDYLSSNGFNEIMSNSLTTSTYYEKLTTYKPEFLVKMHNPISSDLDVMRQTLIFGGLEAIAYNSKRQNADLRLFELGSCYYYNKQNSGKDPLSRYSEDQHLALFITGNKYEDNWNTGEEKSSFYQLKSYLNNIITSLGFDINKINIERIEEKSDIFIDGLVYKTDNKVLIEYGIILKSLTENFDIKEDVFYGDIYWDEIVEELKTHKIEFKELPKYPEVKRDLSLLLNQPITFEQIKKLAFNTEKHYLKRIYLFDVYTGDKIEKGKKSYAVSFVLQDSKSTLTDKKIDGIIKNISDAFVNEFQAKIR
jgi:phenylalanyl-tRNA synthetase beta chain